MRHPSLLPEVRRRRDAEFAKTTSARELELLQLKWQGEDAAMLQADDQQVKELASLRARVAQLERQMSRPKGIDPTLLKAIGGALAETVAGLRSEFESKIAEIEARQLRFCGTFEPGRAYAPNSLAIRKGSLWISLVSTVAPPGGSPDWQLCVKNGELSRAPSAA